MKDIVHKAYKLGQDDARKQSIPNGSKKDWKKAGQDFMTKKNVGTVTSSGKSVWNTSDKEFLETGKMTINYHADHSEAKLYEIIGRLYVESQTEKAVWTAPEVKK